MYGSSPYGVEVYGGLPQVSASSAPASSEELVYHYARSQSKVLDFVDPACPIEWSHPLNRGLVAWWKVVPNSGWRGGLTFRDLARGGKRPSDGTLINGTSFCSVRHIGGYGSVLFDGTDDYTTLGAVGTGSPPLTIIAMVNLTSTSNFYPEFLTAPGGAFGGDNLLRFFGSTSQVNFNDGGVSINTPDALPLNTFSMISVSQDASNTVTLSARWRGGYTTVTDAGSGTAWSSIVLGRRWNMAGNAFPGYLDNVRLHKGIAFTKVQLEALYQEQLRGSPETLRWVGAKTYFLPVAVPLTTTTAYGGSKATELVDPACPVNWSHPLNRGLVRQYKVIPNSGWRGGLTFRDLVRGGKKPTDGTLTNGPTWNGGTYRGGNGSILCDGSNDYVDLGSTSIFSGDIDFTVSFWVRFAATGGGQAMVGFGDSWFLITNFSGNGFPALYVNNFAASVIWSSSIVADTWYYVTASHDSVANELKIAINGGTPVTSSHSGGITSGAQSLTAGMCRAGTNYLGGNIDNVRLWLRVLSNSEISQLYQEQLRGSPETLNWVKTKSYYLPVQETPRSISYGGSKSTELVDPACPIDWSHPLNRGLVGCWSTLPNSGWSGGLKLRDITGKGRHGTLTNFASPFTASSGWVPGYTQGRKSLAFDENDDYVQSANPLLNFTGTGLTVSVWFYKRASQTTKSHLWDAGSESVNGYACYIRPDGNNIEAYVGNGSSADVAFTSTLPTTGRWTLVTVTRNSSLISLYYNGKLVTTGATSGNISSTNSNLRWGLRQDANPLTALIGNLEDPRVYNRCLSAAEVQALYQEQLRGSPETLNWVKTKSYYLPIQETPRSISYGGSKSTELVDPACPVNWDHPLNRGLVGCWSTLPNSGWSGGLKLRDITRKGNDGTLTNFASPFTATSGWVAGKDGGTGALVFEGVNDQCVIIPATRDIQALGQSPTFTACCWVNITTAAVRTILAHENSQWPDFTGNNSGWILITRTSGSDSTIDFTVDTSGSWVGVSGTLISGSWYHVACLYDGTNAKVFINGKETKSAVRGRTLLSPADVPADICRQHAGVAGITGKVYGARFYNRALSASEVRALYQEQLRGSPETLNWVKSKSYSIFTPSAGGGSTDVSGTGSLLFGSMICAGTGTRTNPVVTATGSLTLGSMTCAGTGSTVVARTGTGSLSFGSMTCTGTGTRTNPVRTATGSLSFGSMTCAGTGTRTNPVFSATGSLSFGSMTCTGIGSTVVTRTGTGSLSFGPMTCSGTGTRTDPIRTGTGSLSFGSMTCAGTGTRTNPVRTATGALTFSAMTCAGTGNYATVVLLGSGSLAFGSMTCAGTASYSAGTKTGTGSLSFGPMTCAGIGTRTAPSYTATGSLSFSPMTCSGTGTRTAPVRTGTGSLTLSSITCAGTGTAGEPTFSGIGSLLLGAITIIGSGAFVLTNVTATAALSLGSMVLSGIGTFLVGTIVRYFPTIKVNPVRPEVKVNNTRPVLVWRNPMSTVKQDLEVWRSEDVRIRFKIHSSVDISDWSLWEFKAWVFNSVGEPEIEATLGNGRIVKTAPGEAYSWFKQADNEALTSLIGNKYQVWRTDTDESFPLIVGKYKVRLYERPE